MVEKRRNQPAFSFSRIPRVRIVRVDETVRGKENALPHCSREEVQQGCSKADIKEEPQLPCVFHSELDLQDAKPAECSVSCTCGDCIYLLESKERVRQKVMEEIARINQRPMPPLRKLTSSDLLRRGIVPAPPPIVYCNAETQTTLKTYKYTCKKCFSEFNNSEYYNHHLTSHYPKVFGCAYCPATFPSKTKLRGHHLFHINRNFYECIHCGAAFAKKGSLRKHMREHENKNIWSCNICSAKFDKSVHLEVHRRKHEFNSTGGLIHVFRKVKNNDMCSSGETISATVGAAATDFNDAASSGASNTGFYTCNKCKKLTFKTLALQKRHELLHQRKHGIHVCQVCDARFVRKFWLDTHKKHAH